MLSAQVLRRDRSRHASSLMRMPPTAWRRCAARRRWCVSRDEMRQTSTELKQFLLRNLYRHAQVMETTDQARRIVRDLFEAYMHAPQDMQPGFAARCVATDAQADGMHLRARTVADFIAGMTDRFALREHERITGLRLMG